MNARLADPLGTLVLLLRRTALLLSTRELDLGYAPSIDGNPWRWTAPSNERCRYWNPIEVELSMATGAWNRPWCAHLNRANLGSRVEVAGWIRRRRDLGGLVFADLRDRTGIVQLVFEGEMVPVGEHLSPEDVVLVRGTVRERAEGQANPNLPSGEKTGFSSCSKGVAVNRCWMFPFRSTT